jgi:type II secretory pathway pseudopilin PulG
VIAFAVFVIAVLALLTGYFGYSARMRSLRIATIGQNLAQLEMENLRSMSKDVLSALVRGDSTDVNYVNTTDHAFDPLRWDRDLSDIAYDSGVDGDGIGLIDGTFYIANVATVSGHAPATMTDYPAVTLPTDVVDVRPATNTRPDGSTWLDYTVTLHKSVFPGYKKRIKVTDLTVDAQGKGLALLVRLEVTVYWKENGRMKQYSLSSEK